MSYTSLKYTDRTDRAFGLCGMALSLFIFDAEEYLDSLSLDAPADMGLKLSSDFFAPSNPCFSVKKVWSSSFRHFQLATAMATGNLLSRSIARRRSELPNEVKLLILRQLSQEGEDSCGLDMEEVENIFDNAYSYLRSLFLHPGVNSAICDMAAELEKETTLRRDRVMPYLSRINSL